MHPALATGDVISAPMDTADQTARTGGPEMWLYGTGKTI